MISLVTRPSHQATLAVPLWRKCVDGVGTPHALLALSVGLLPGGAKAPKITCGVWMKLYSMMIGAPLYSRTKAVSANIAVRCNSATAPNRVGRSRHSGH